MRGNKIKSIFNQSLAEMRSNLDTLTREKAAYNENIQRLSRSINVACHDIGAALFQCHLEGQNVGSMEARFSSHDQKLKALRAQRVQQVSSLEAQIAQGGQTIERMQGDFSKEVAALENALAESSEYWDAKRRLQEANEEHVLNEKVYKRVSNEASRKLQLFKESSAFMHLLNRGFDTNEYKGWWLTRYFDRRIAKYTDFKTSKLNFDLLGKLEAQAAEQLARSAEFFAQMEKEVSAIEAHMASGYDVEGKRNALKNTRQNLSKKKAEAAQLERLISRMDDHKDEITEQLLSSVGNAIVNDFDTLRQEWKSLGLARVVTLSERVVSMTREIHQQKQQLTLLEPQISLKKKAFDELEAIYKRLSKKLSSDYTYTGSAERLISDFMLGSLTPSALQGELDRSLRYSPEHISYGSFSFGHSSSSGSSLGGSSWSTGDRIGGGGSWSTDDRF